MYYCTAENIDSLSSSMVGSSHIESSNSQISTTLTNLDEIIRIVAINNSEETVNYPLLTFGSDVNQSQANANLLVQREETEIHRLSDYNNLLSLQNDSFPTREELVERVHEISLRQGFITVIKRS